MLFEDYDKYLKHNKFDKYLKKLNEKLKNKKIVIYGAGEFFQYLKENYDFSNLNIVGISDLKFKDEQEGEDCLGYKIIPREKIIDYNPDCILVAVLRYTNIIEDFKIRLFKDTNIKIYPISRIPLWDFIRLIWS